MTATVVDLHRSCTACLDTRRCWVCTGRGEVPTRDGTAARCPSCAGRTLCRVCHPDPSTAARSNAA